MAQAAPGVRLRIGGAVIAAADLAQAQAAIAAQNAQQRLNGLPDELNPGIIDPAKFEALLRALAPDSASVLAGRPLFLDAAALGIGASAPTTVASFRAPVSLAAPPGQEGGVSAKAGYVVDCALARTQAEAARAATLAAEQAVAQGGDAAARVRRYAVARVWAENAAAAASCAPGDAAAAADRDAAARAAEQAVMRGGSMG